MAVVGRSRELAAATTALESGLDGAPTFLAVRGPSGIGTTTLLEELRRVAQPHRAVEVVGHEDERSVPWAGVSQVVLALRDLLPRLDPHPASTLRTALGLAAGPEPTVAQVAIALVELLATAAEPSGAVVWIDDHQWLDPTSRDVIAFAARRTTGLPVAVVAAERDDVGGGTARATDVVELRPLDDTSAAALLADVGVDEPGVVASIVDACGGSPLALVEVAGALTPGQRAGRDALPRPLPVGAALVAEMTARIAALPAGARRTLLALSAAGGAPIDQVLDAARADPDDLVAAEAAGLLILAPGSVAFRRPIVRSAVFWAASDAERRDVHLALAKRLEDPVVATLHRADALVGLDDQVALALVQHAEDARAHGAAATAVELLQRARSVAASGDVQTRVALLAAGSAVDAGRADHARELLADLDDDVPGRAWLDARCAAAIGSPIEARLRYRRAADEAGPAETTVRCTALLEAAALSLALFDADGAAADLDAAPLPDDPELGDRLVASRAGVALLRGAPSDAERFHRMVRRLGRDRPARQPEAGPDAPATDELWWAIGVALPVLNRAGELDRATDVAAAVRRRAARWGHPELVVAALTEQAKIVARHDFAASEALAREAVDLASDVGLLGRLRFALGVWANALGALGSDEIHEAIQRLEELDVRLVGDLYLAFHHVTHERFAEALDVLVRVDADPAARRTGLLWQADLAEAAWRCGDDTRLAAATDELGRIADATGFTWARAAQLRYVAVQVAGDEQRGHFEHSARLFDGAGAAVAAARTRLAWGELARRARRRAEARTQLGLARAAFLRAGMHRWVERCDRELVAAGAAAPNHAADSSVAGRPASADALTSHERTVARQLVGGATYREIAAQLFVSPRTVETHASAIYRKLGVGNRGQLAALARTDPSLAG